MSVNLVAPTVEDLIFGMMPWLERGPAVSSDLDRGRTLSRGEPPVRFRSPSLSPFWTSHSLFYRLVQSNFPSFASSLRTRPTVVVSRATSELGPGTYAMTCRGIKIWNPPGGPAGWVDVQVFDGLDCLVSFVLTERAVYFTLSA